MQIFAQFIIPDTALILANQPKTVEALEETKRSSEPSYGEGIKVYQSYNRGARTGGISIE